MAGHVLDLLLGRRRWVCVAPRSRRDTRRDATATPLKRTSVLGWPSRRRRATPLKRLVRRLAACDAAQDSGGWRIRSPGSTPSAAASRRMVLMRAGVPVSSRPTDTRLRLARCASSSWVSARAIRQWRRPGITTRVARGATKVEGMILGNCTAAARPRRHGRWTTAAACVYAAAYLLSYLTLCVAFVGDEGGSLVLVPALLVPPASNRHGARRGRAHDGPRRCLLAGSHADGQVDLAGARLCGDHWGSVPMTPHQETRHVATVSGHAT